MVIANIQLRFVSLIALLAVAAVHIQLTTASVIAVGTLQSCFNNGTTTVRFLFSTSPLCYYCSHFCPSITLQTDALDCQKKIIVSLALENNHLYQTETLDFTIACINSTDNKCPCTCVYGQDHGCECRDLRRSIAVSVTKTPVFAVYPLSQPRNFNGRPYEVRMRMRACLHYFISNKD